MTLSYLQFNNDNNNNGIIFPETATNTMNIPIPGSIHGSYNYHKKQNMIITARFGLKMFHGAERNNMVTFARGENCCRNNAIWDLK